MVVLVLPLVVVKVGVAGVWHWKFWVPAQVTETV